MEICFEEQDFDGFLDTLRQYPHIEYLSEVMEHDWGQRVVRFYDPDGHMIEVGEDMKMVINRFLTSGTSGALNRGSERNPNLQLPMFKGRSHTASHLLCQQSGNGQAKPRSIFSALHSVITVK